ncbi:hypothetical protein D1007_41937 [Hordeum vulgare]|nr:hypothetical protein D1007_41937 [Hordeum vulgare]
MTRDKSWLDKERDSVEGQTGMKNFLNFAFDGPHPKSVVPCPCRKCLNSAQRNKKEVHTHLLYYGMDQSYTHWIYHGEQPDEGIMYEDSDNEDDVDDGAGMCDMLHTLIRGTGMESNVDHDEGLDEAVEDDEGGEADVMDVIDAEITVAKITLPEEITSWSRNDDEGSSIDVSVITNIKPVEFEDYQFESDDDTDDDEAYVNDGHVAPLGEEELDDDEGFFV